ncbi:hypothetical protein ScPMuIL_004943 [Solemya velum]
METARTKRRQAKTSIEPFQMDTEKDDFDKDDDEENFQPTMENGEALLEVECGTNKAKMYLSKLAEGSKGPCVFFHGSWLTPNEFQYVSGRATAKDWKRSIRYNGKSLKLLFAKGILSLGATTKNGRISKRKTKKRSGRKPKAGKQIVDTNKEGDSEKDEMKEESSLEQLDESSTENSTISHESENEANEIETNEIGVESKPSEMDDAINEPITNTGAPEDEEKEVKVENKEAVDEFLDDDTEMASDEECSLAEVTPEDTGTQRVIDDMENGSHDSIGSIGEKITQVELPQKNVDITENVSSDVDQPETIAKNKEEEHASSDQASSEEDVENDKLDYFPEEDSPVCTHLSETKKIDENDNDEMEKSIELPTRVEYDTEEDKEECKKLGQSCSKEITACVAVEGRNPDTIVQTQDGITEDIKSNIITSVDAFEFPDDEDEIVRSPVHDNGRYFRVKSATHHLEHAHVSDEQSEHQSSVNRQTEHELPTRQPENGPSPEQQPEKESESEMGSQSVNVSEKFQNKDSDSEKMDVPKENGPVFSKSPILEKTLHSTKKSESVSSTNEVTPLTNSNKTEVCSAFSVSNKANYLSKLLQELRESKQEQCSSSSTVSSTDTSARSSKAEKTQVKGKLNGVLPSTSENHKSVHKSEKLFFQTSDSRNIKSSIENVVPPKIDYITNVKDKRHNGLIENDSSMKQNKFRAQQPVSTKAENYSDYMRMLASTCVQPSIYLSQYAADRIFPFKSTDVFTPPGACPPQHFPFGVKFPPPKCMCCTPSSSETRTSPISPPFFSHLQRPSQELPLPFFNPYFAFPPPFLPPPWTHATGDKSSTSKRTLPKEGNILDLSPKKVKFSFNET